MEHNHPLLLQLPPPAFSRSCQHPLAPDHIIPVSAFISTALRPHWALLSPYGDYPEGPPGPSRATASIFSRASISSHLQSLLP